MRRSLLALALSACSIAAGFAVVGAGRANAAPNTSAVALTAAGELVPLTIAPGNPPVVMAGAPVAVTGLVAGQTLVGLDYRPATGGLYALGMNTTSGSTSLYTVNAATGALTSVAAPIDLSPAPSWGFDFNPTVDRIRVIGSTGANYRLHPDTGALAFNDTAPTFVGTDPNAGDFPNIASAAYTNNFGAGTTTPTGAKATTLFALEAGNDALVAIDNPNTGEVRTVGLLGSDVDTDAEFDITTNGVAYALVSNAGIETLRNVNLSTGALGSPSLALSLGSAVVGFAVETGASPVVAGDDGYGVNAAGELVTFELGDPTNLYKIGPISGLAPGFLIEGIDHRPATGILYAIAVNVTTQQAQLLQVNRTSGAPTAVGTPFSIVPATDYGFDFNPTVDRIRFVTSDGANYRIHPDTGALAFTDGALAYNAGDSATAAPFINSTAYSNSFAPVGGTIHYGVDATQNTLAVFTDSNNGKLRTAAKLSLAATPFDITSDTGLDVAKDGRIFLTAPTTDGTRLFTINPITGALAASGTNNKVGAGAELRAFTVGPNFTRPTVTITADAKSRPFGAANPAFTFTATGFSGSDTAASIDTPPVCTTTATASSPVGVYPITCAGAADSFYEFAYVAGQLTVGKANTKLIASPPIRLPAINLREGTASLLNATTNNGIPGALVTFTTGGTFLCSATTNSNGVAKCAFAQPTPRVDVLLNSGYTVTFAGNTNLNPSTANSGLVGSL